MDELIDKKVDDKCRFVQKNKIRAVTYIQILATFHHITLIIFNKKFQFQSPLECEVQLLLAHLLVPLALAGRPHFRLVLEASSLTASLIVGLVIGGVESISGEFAFILLRSSRWKVLMIWRRCSTAKVGS